MTENKDNESHLEIDEELEAYLNASKISKSKFSKAVQAHVAEEDFSWIGLAHLLAQEMDDDYPNPLHAYFPKKIIDAAKKFIKAEDLMNEYQSTLALDLSSAIMNVDDIEASEISDEEMNELLNKERK